MKVNPAAGALSFTDRLSLSLPVTAACAVALLRSGRGARIRGDAALAMLSVGAMGLGHLLMNLFPGSSNVAGDVCSTLFGSTSILTLSPGDVRLCAALSLLVAAFFALFRHRVFEVVFDPDFARSCGTRTALWETALAGMTPPPPPPVPQGTVDIDLTATNRTMVYSQIFDMMQSPGPYRGKTVRMKGTYATTVPQGTTNRYHA